MKPLLLTLLLFPLSLFATQPIKNSVSIFNILLNCPTEENMEQICQQYGFNYEGEKCGFVAYSCGDGTLTRFKMKNLDSNITVPVIKTTTFKNKKEITQLLKSLDFQKEGGHYIKGHKYGRTQQKVTLSENKKDKTITLVCTKILTTNPY